MSYLYTVRVMKYVLGISSLLFYDGTVFLIGALYPCNSQSRSCGLQTQSIGIVMFEMSEAEDCNVCIEVKD